MAIIERTTAILTCCKNNWLPLSIILTIDLSGLSGKNEQHLMAETIYTRGRNIMQCQTFDWWPHLSILSITIANTELSTEIDTRSRDLKKQAYWRYRLRLDGLRSKYGSATLIESMPTARLAMWSVRDARVTHFFSSVRAFRTYLESSHCCWWVALWSVSGRRGQLEWLRRNKPHNCSAHWCWLYELPECVAVQASL